MCQARFGWRVLRFRLAHVHSRLWSCKRRNVVVEHEERGRVRSGAVRTSTSLRGSGAGTADGAKSDDLEALLNEDGTLKEPQPEASGDYWDDEGWDDGYVDPYVCTEGTRAFFLFEWNHMSLLVRCHKAVCRPAFARQTSDITCS
jgi:hypothetical protein